MSKYSDSRSYMTSLLPGDSVQLWNAEQPVPGSGGVSATAPLALALSPGKDTQIEVDGFFSGTPGVFEIDVQAADVDADAQYNVISSGVINAVDSVNQTFHFDFKIVARFVRLLMRSRANAVNVTAALRRG